MKRFRTSGASWLAVGAWLVTGALPTRGAENWIGFQGGGKLVDASAEDATIGDGWTPAWRADIDGFGQSSPVVYDGAIYVTSIDGPMKETGHVTAFDLETGARKWRHDFDTASRAENNNYVSRAAPTPVADAAGVVAFFESGDVVALTPSGEIRWTRNLVADHGAIAARHGISASLEQLDDRVFVWVERQDDPYVLALSKFDGKTLWKAPGVGGTSWASPRLAPMGFGESHLVLSGVGSLVGLDPATGERRWRLSGVKGNSSPTPCSCGEGRLLVGATVGRGESDGGKAAEFNGVAHVRRDESGAWSADYQWRAERATSSFGSPIAHQGHAYVVNAAGVAFCLDVETGEERWSQRVGDGLWATPLGRGDRVVFVSRSGRATIVAAGAQFKKLAEHELLAKQESTESSERGERTGPSIYAIAVVRDRLLAREGSALICVDLGAK